MHKYESMTLEEFVYFTKKQLDIIENIDKKTIDPYDSYRTWEHWFEICKPRIIEDN
jgi:hypothetical protein